MIGIIQRGFLGVGAGGGFFGRKEYSSRNTFSRSMMTFLEKRAGETVLWSQRMVSPA